MAWHAGKLKPAVCTRLMLTCLHGLCRYPQGGITFEYLPAEYKYLTVRKPAKVRTHHIILGGAKLKGPPIFSNMLSNTTTERNQAIKSGTITYAVQPNGLVRYLRVAACANKLNSRQIPLSDVCVGWGVDIIHRGFRRTK
eukprot:109847-Pyramimonas_sp.AAC.1